jgi:hypothetical protein
VRHRVKSEVSAITESWVQHRVIPEVCAIQSEE